MMLLAEALATRKDMQVRAGELQARLCENVIVQEGDQPSEAPEALYDQLAALYAELADLMARINKTNLAASVRLPNGKITSITVALAGREVLRQHIAALRKVVAASQPSRLGWRIGRSEIKSITVISIADWNRRIDLLQRDLRVLDTAIQQSGWITQLVEE